MTWAGKAGARRTRAAGESRRGGGRSVSSSPDVIIQANHATPAETIGKRDYQRDTSDGTKETFGGTRALNLLSPNWPGPPSISNIRLAVWDLSFGAL